MNSSLADSSSPRMRLIAWLTLGLYVILGLTMTHIPHVPSQIMQFGDKHLHFAGYFVYAALTYIAFGLNFPRLRGLSVIIILFFAGFAALDELTQPFFGRDCDYYDWRADMFGVTTAVVLLVVLRMIASRRVSDASALES